jgi:holin-like protein
VKIIKQSGIIFGVTMAGEFLNTLLPLPVPAGVYGLFILLALLCSGILKLENVESVGGFLTEIMPIMFIPVTAGLIDDYALVKDILGLMVVISVVSTIFVMAVTGLVGEHMVQRDEKEDRR